jgi:uncharacterized protein YfaS (alpha-2-macroglobulin family)
MTTKHLFLLTTLLLIALFSACTQQAPATVTRVVEVTATAAADTAASDATVSETAVSIPTTPTPTPTAVPTTLTVTLPGDLKAHHPGDPLTFYFNQPLNPHSASRPVILSPSIRGDISWNAEHTIFSFTPEESFAPGRIYNVTLPATLTSASGQTFSTVQRFRVTMLHTPTVINRLPSRTIFTTFTPQISLGFSDEMNADTVQAALTLEPPIAHTTTWDDNRLLITIEEPLQFNTIYTATLGKTAVNTDQISMAAPYNWNFRLADPLQEIDLPNTTNPTAPIALHFNYPMDDATLRTALTIKPEISGKLTWNADHTSAILQPNAQLPANTTYTISFNGPLQDRSGHPLPPLDEYHFTTPPPILSHTPEGSGINPIHPIRIRFDRLMDTAVTNAAFSINPPTPGQIRWEETSLIFTPDQGYFDPHSTYTVTIDANAASTDGQPLLTEPITWQFTTGEFEEVASFGYGPNAQVLDANGRRAIQFEVQSREKPIVRFDLHQLTLEQFLDRYASNFRGAAGWDETPIPDISTADAPLVRQWRMETTDPVTDWANVQETIIPADVSPGLYILNLNAGPLNDQLILIVTANTIATKQAAGQLVSWVTDINGPPAANVEMGIYARNGRILAQGIADENGLFRTELLPFEEGGPAALEPLIIVAQSGNDITVSGLSPEWQSGSGYRDWWSPQPASATSAAFIFTERPIYKPGQTVYFKAIVRQNDDALLTVPPAGTAVTIHIRDARNNVVQTQELFTNDFGSVDGRFLLAEGAMLGQYTVAVTAYNQTHSQIFKVEDYRKPDYSVTVTTDQPSYLPGDTVQITVDAAYYFGEPVANAQVTIRRFTSDAVRYYGAQDWWEDYRTANTPLTGFTDANGRFTTTIRISPDDVYDGYNDWGSNQTITRLGLDATVNDGSNQTVSGFHSVNLHSRAEEISANLGSYVQKPATPFSISANVHDLNGQPVANRSLTIELRRWNSNSYDYSQVIQSLQLVTDENGRISTPFTIETPGYYQWRITGQDSLGNQIRYKDYVYAFSDFFDNWYGRSDSELLITTDQESYAPGDTAQLLIETPYSGPALLVRERGTVRDEQLILLTAPLTTLSLPITAADVPNIYISINYWQENDTEIQQYTYESQPDSHLRTGYVNISVPADDKRLTVQITPDQAQYAPGEQATFTVRVTNHKGEPVSAELSFALVDEAIFALSPELNGPMYDSFYYERASIVHTHNSLRPVRYLGGYGGGGGGGGDGEGWGGPRTDFLDTAVWQPTLYTDFNGEATITTTLPDNLTTWRATVKAATADTQIGEAIANITTWQPIIIRPILPRTLTTGDSLQISALVHNYSDTEQGLAVSLNEWLDAESEAHLEIAAPITQTIILQPGEVRIVGWSAAVLAAGEAQLLAQVQYNTDPNTLAPTETADAILLPLTINPLAIPDVTTQVGQFRTNQTLPIAVPNGALEMSTVEVQLSRSIAGTLLTGLEYLTGYPYGCVEQTMSKALPNAVVGRALNQLGVTNPTLAATLPGQISASIQRLYGYQHNDGGWGWWFDDPSHDYQTAWVIFGLAQVADAGYEVDPGVIERGAQWLNDHLSDMDVRTRAFALYAMAAAGQPNETATVQLAEARSSLNGDVFSLAGLALALHMLGDDALAQTIVDELADTAVTTNGQTHWSGANHDGYYYDKVMASDIRSTALALSAFTQIQPGHPLEANMVRWLMAQRRTAGWGTTNETSFAIIGLTDHLLTTAYSEAAAATNYTVQLNGETIANGQLGPGAPAVTLTIPQSQLNPGENTLTLTQDGNLPLYYTVNGRMYVAESEIAAAGIIEISRTYSNPETGATLELDAITAGQLVQVNLQITMPQSGSYMIIEDRLPGGLEALNERLNTTSRFANEYWMYDSDVYTWQTLGYNNKEIRADRVSFFITEMNSGVTQLTYLARATHNGTFTAMPTEAYGMYTLELWGRSASHQITISKQ